MSEFKTTDSPSLSKHRKLDDRGLPPNVSMDSFESSSEVGLSGAASISGDGDSSPFEGPDCPFILPDEWEVNNHCSFLSKKRLLKIRLAKA